MKKPYLYVAATTLLPWGHADYRTKVGITSDPEQRARGILKYADGLKMVAIFKMPRDADGFEKVIKDDFSHSVIEGTTELFNAPEEDVLEHVLSMINHWKIPHERIL